jgi:hypothetical protein
MKGNLGVTPPFHSISIYFSNPKKKRSQGRSPFLISPIIKRDDDNIPPPSSAPHNLLETTTTTTRKTNFLYNLTHFAFALPLPCLALPCRSSLPTKTRSNNQSFINRAFASHSTHVCVGVLYSIKENNIARSLSPAKTPRPRRRKKKN